MILSRSYELKHINILLYTGGDSRSVETPGPGAFKTAHCFRYTSARPPRLPILKRGEKGQACPNAILLPRLKPGAGVSYFTRPRVPTARHCIGGQVAPLALALASSSTRRDRSSMAGETANCLHRPHHHETSKSH